jgi:hypothetical protein
MLSRRSFLLGFVYTAAAGEIFAPTAPVTSASTSTSIGVLTGGGGVGIAGHIPDYGSNNR